MKQLTKDILISLLMGVLVPAMVLNFAAALWNRQREPAPAEIIPQESTEAATVSLPVRVRRGETVEEGDMDTYLVGVVLAEMPASFEPEALKAQSVVARTYAQKAYITGGKHGDGSVCTASACCQAYIDEADYLAKGGKKENVEKIRSAVFATAGEILTYNGQIIEATYFSCSGGSTEDAAAVWGTDFPYLQAVDSPGEEHASHYEDTVTFTPSEVSEALGVRLTGPPAVWIGAVTRTDGGGVETIEIGGTEFSGTEIRTLLGLRSASFDIYTSLEEITVTTRGHGHRVGMSQYGADAMAVTGSTYRQILAHYYQGTELMTLSNHPSGEDRSSF